MEYKYCFVAVEFPDDVNVAGNFYWYLCPFENVMAGDKVVVPLGRHNHTQTGVVRRVLFAPANSSPYPFNLIKSVIKIVE